MVPIQTLAMISDQAERGRGMLNSLWLPNPALYSSWVAHVANLLNAIPDQGVAFAGQWWSIPDGDANRGLTDQDKGLFAAGMNLRLQWLQQFFASNVPPLRPPAAAMPAPPPKPTAGQGDFVFVGHGRSPFWRELKDFLQERLGLRWDEFNRESAAGIATTERLEEMLNRARFAFLVMTAEDEHGDGRLHARQNVIHEVGLFQGRLGFRRAIILLEHGCEPFSNIAGLTWIGFPKGNIRAVFEEVRQVLQREGILS